MIKIWNVEDKGEPVAVLEGHSSRIIKTIFHPSVEGLLASASGDNTVKLWYGFEVCLC